MSAPQRILFAIGALSFLLVPAYAQKHTVGLEDAKKWEMPGPYALSRDGHWLSYQIQVIDGDGRLVVKNNDTPETWSTPNGSAAQFSDDSKWCAYLISPPKAVADKLKEEHKPVENRLGFRDLSNGSERILEGVQTFGFLKGSRTLVVRRTRGTSKPDGGSDFDVINLATGAVLTIGNVSSAQANKAGSLIAATILSDSGDKGVQIIDPASSTVRSAVWGRDEIGPLAWDENGDAIAVLVGKTDEKKEGPFNRVVIARNLGGVPKLTFLDPASETAFPKNCRIGDRPPLINADGSIVALGVQPWLDKRPPAKPGSKAAPEVWNTKDIRPVSEQRTTAGQDRARTDTYVWMPDKKVFRQLDDGQLQAAMPLKGLTRFVLVDDKPYASPSTNGWEFHDVWLIDAETGQKRKILEKSHWIPTASREGGFLAYYQGRRWLVYDIAHDKTLDPLRDLHTTFEDTEDDHTTPEKEPASSPVWLAADAGVIVADRYDSFLINTPAGTATQLTNGRKDRQIYRFIVIDPHEEGPKLGEPLFFSIFDDDLKATGFYTTDATGKGKVLALDTARMIGLRKAALADRVVFRMESWAKSPNLYLTNTAFSQMKPETKTNPQQDSFLWGKTELVSYKSRWGKSLQGVLIYPADYDAKRRYPMVTLIYERLSDNLNNYTPPVDYSTYNTQWLSQNGYFVFMPDIAYRGRVPGQSAVDCLEPAVDAVLNKRVGVDPDRVGLMGHSWGAYQTAYVTTVSKTFRVGVAGAPLTDLPSMYGTPYWNEGMFNGPILETSQGRLEVPFWEDPKAYIDNSPVWQSKKRTAPILITFGDQDGAVDYHQGLELYNTLRRMGKDAVLLLYYGENHGFNRREDELDYAHRARHYLDVYLKGVKPEPWISEGVPFIHRED